MDSERKKLLNSIRKQNNKIISTDKKQIKSHKKKLRKMNNKLLSTCQSNNVSISTGDCSATSQEKEENFYELEIQILRKELVSFKDSEKACKTQIVNLQRSIRRCNEEASIQKKITIRLENETDELNSKILKQKIEVDSLKQKIKEYFHFKDENVALKSEIKKYEY